MPQSTAFQDAARHSWIEEFMASPAEKLADLLAGYVQIALHEQSDARTLARVLFVPLDNDDPARAALDEAVLDWLDARRREGKPSGEIEEAGRTLSQICDAFRLISLVSLPGAAIDLRNRFLLWRSWAESLAGMRPDVRAEFFNCTAMTQRLVARTDTSVDRFGLEPMWLSICGQAARLYPESYLSIGLLGLRQLPERAGAPSVLPWMAGLLSWASMQRPTVRQFSAHWKPLKALYPLTRDTWQKSLAMVVERIAIEARNWGTTPDAIVEPEILEFWQRDVGIAPKAEGARASRLSPLAGKPAAARLAPPSVIDDIVRGASGPLKDIAAKIQTVIDERENYAQCYGDSSFLVKDATKIGMRLLKSGPRGEAVKRGEFAAQLARLAISWSPNNLFSWSLWRDAYAAQGKLDTAESIAWDSVRRFPESDQKRNQLALLLSQQKDRWDDAEALLRETMRRFPNDTVCRNQLARLLMQQPEKRRDAAALLWETVKQHPQNDWTRSELALFLSQNRDTEAQAEEVLRDAVREFDNNIVFVHQLGLLLARRGKRAEAEKLLRQALERHDAGVVTKRSLAYVLAHDVAQYDEAESLLDQVLRENPDDRFAANLREHILRQRKRAQNAAEPPSDQAQPNAPFENLLRNLLDDAIERAPSLGGLKAFRAPSAETPEPEDELQKADLNIVAMEPGPAAPQEREEPPAVAPRVEKPAKVQPTAAARPPVKTDRAAARAKSGRRAIRDEFLEAVLRGGQLRRIEAELPRKHENEAWRRAAAATVAVARDADLNDPYSKFVEERLGRYGELAAARDGLVPFAQKAAGDNSALRPLVDLAKTYMNKDMVAGANVVRWWSSPPSQDPRQLAVLRAFFEIRFAAIDQQDRRRITTTDLSEFVNLIAANDNIPIDLMEAALAAA